MHRRGIVNKVQKGGIVKKIPNRLWQISFFQSIWNHFIDGLNLRLRINSLKYIAHYLSQIGQNGNLQTPITLLKKVTGKISFQI